MLRFRRDKCPGRFSDLQNRIRHRHFLFHAGCLLACLGSLVLGPAADTHAQERGRNQLGDLFRRLDRGIRDSAEDIKNNKSARDQVDIRPIQRPEDNRRFQQAKDLIRQQKWDDAVEVLQFLLEQPSDAFSLNDDHEFQSLQNEADQLIAGLPPEGMRNYENRYAVIAQQKLDSGIAAQNDLLLVEVSAHYFHTPAGRKALGILARQWQDQGEFGRSAEAWQQLLQTADESEKVLLTRATARVLALAGRFSEARKLAESLSDHQVIEQDLRQLQERDFHSSESGGPYLQFAQTNSGTENIDPAPLPCWSAQLIERYAVTSQIYMLSAELMDQGRTLIPTIQPLTVGGKLAFRTLRSLQVREITSGQLLWERRTLHSPEELLTGMEGAEDIDRDVYQYSPDSMVEQHPLASLLYRDEIYGGLSSDGTHLFAVESTGEAALSAPLHMWQLHVEGNAAKTPWETNELTAYDLQTGLVRWRIGGTAIEKEFSRPLAGTRFLSAPTPEGPELYVLGERNGEVLLFCLETQSGDVLWEQPLATPGRPVREDMVRSHWPGQPVLSEGHILCPTTCGWLIAVDRMTHRLKWSTRFFPRMSQPNRFRGSYGSQPLQELNRRWQGSFPIVVGKYILYTPPEMPDEFGMTQPMLLCIDSRTGDVLWEQPKSERSGGTGLYVAGIWDQQVVIVGSRSVIGRKLGNSGEILWSVRLPDQPTGRGLLVKDTLLLPVAGTRLLKIDLKSSRIEKTILPAVKGELGNLVLSQGHLVAATYEAIVCLPATSLPRQDQVQPEVLVRTQLGESRLLLESRQYAALEAKLESILKTAALPDDLRLEIRDLQRAGLQQQLQSTPENADALLNRLEQLSQTPQEQRDFQRIRADHWLHTGKGMAALAAYLDILDQFPPDQQIEDGTLVARTDSWIGGRLQQLFQAASPETKAACRTEIQERVEKLVAEKADIKRLDRWARALSQEQAGLQLELDLAAREFERGSQAAGLIRLSRVIDSENPVLRPRGLLEMAQRLVRLGWHEDALQTWQQLRKYPDVHFPSHKLKSAELAEAGIAAAREAIAQHKSSPTPWGEHWTVERVGVSGNERNSETIPVEGRAFRSLADLRLVHESDNNRMRVENGRSGEFLTSFPLRSNPLLEHNPSVGARMLTSSMLIVHGGILHLLAWPDQEILWTWNSEMRGQALARMALVQPNQHYTLLPVHQFAVTQQSAAHHSSTGYLRAVTPRALLLYCKDWIALDPLTGEELWRERTTTERNWGQELGADWLMISTRSGHSVRNAVSGLSRVGKALYESTNRPILITDQELILLNRFSRNRTGQSMHDLRSVDLSGNTKWKTTIPAESQLGLPDGQTLIVLHPDHQLHAINLTNGETTALGKIDNIPSVIEGSDRSISVFCDEERIYVVLDQNEVRRVYLNLPAIRVSGEIRAFSRTGQPLWTFKTPSLSAASSKRSKSPPSSPWAFNMLVQDFREIPLLLLVGDDPRQDPELELQYHQIRVMGLDKATGVPRVDWERPSESGGFTYLQLDVQQHFIELRTYNERLRLTSGTEQTLQETTP